MSLTRHFFNEVRPFFRLFDEVARTYPSPAFRGRHWDDFDFPLARRPSVDLSEHGNDYVVQAELPGVKKENLDVRVGDQGRSLTIEGRIVGRINHESASAAAQNSDASTNTTSTEVTSAQTDATMPISSDRESSSHFTRTVWLPRAIDPSKVTGSLTDGILTLRIPKATDQGSIKVDIQ